MHLAKLRQRLVRRITSRSFITGAAAYARRGLT